MSSRDKKGPENVRITRTDYGYSIQIRDPDPSVRYLPVDPVVVQRAIQSSSRSATKKRTA